MPFYIQGSVLGKLVREPTPLDEKKNELKSNMDVLRMLSLLARHKTIDCKKYGQSVCDVTHRLSEEQD